MTDTPNTTQGKGAVDWAKPIEAVAAGCPEVPATFVQHLCGIPIVDVPGVGEGLGVDKNGRIGWHCSWTIRNVETRDDTVTPEHPTPTQYAPELVERMVATIRILAGCTPCGESEGERLLIVLAQTIVSDLPQEVDPDEEEASDLVKKLSREGFIFGNTDQAESVAVAGIKRGRQLQRGETK